MEDSLSPERAPAHGSEQKRHPLDIGSQASATEEKGEPTNEDAKSVEAEKCVKVTGEFRKTWGFRRTTIAKRETPGDMDSPDSRNAPVRRSGRQAKRTDKMEEFLSTAKRGRGGRRSAPAHLETSDPPSQTPTDAETTSEASFDGNAETKAADNKKSPERPRGRRGRRAAKPKGGSVSDNGSSENDEDNEEMPTAEEEQAKAEVVKTKDPEVQAEAKDKDEEDEKEGEEKRTTESRQPSLSPARASSKDSTPKKRATRPRVMRRVTRDRRRSNDGGDEDENSSDESENEGYDPNALYCICRQKHNKRFMICCDRCEEWFHGDCVGITEARGRLLERNGEDYICPNCTVQKSRSTSPGSASESEKRPLRKAVQNTATEQAGSHSGAEEKPGEDLGIKGRIEKAANPSGKKKIKIFQPAVEAAAAEVAGTAGGTVAGTAAATTAAAAVGGAAGPVTGVTAGVTVGAAAGAELPKCIGPGCGKIAQPDSVYCGNDCILRHAAAAMKSITDVKEAKPKEKAKPKAQKKPAARSAKKRSVPQRRAVRKSTESSGQPGEDEESDSEDEEDEEEEEQGERKEQEPAIASWSSDHNYNAVTPEKTAPNASSVFNKSCMYLLQVLETHDIFQLLVSLKAIHLTCENW